MLREQKEQLSSLMDGEYNESLFIEEASQDEELQRSWHRYHIVRDAMNDKLHQCSLTLDITENVAKAIALDELFDQSTSSQTQPPEKTNLFWIRTKEVIAKLSQVGLAACVTLGIIAGVQYQQGSTSNNDSPVLNTVPVGVNLAPVGGIPANEYNKQQEDLEQKNQLQYSKIRLLVQDYELQKRLNTQ